MISIVVNDFLLQNYESRILDNLDKPFITLTEYVEELVDACELCPIV